MTHAVAVNGLRVRWPRVEGEEDQLGLDGVSLTIAPGEVVGLVGETGSGRSTLARALNGIVPRLVRATLEGTIDVAGLTPASTGVADMARVVAVVLDDPEAQMTQPTVLDEVAFALENLGVPPDEIRGRVGAALDRVGLGGFEARSPLTLSGGEQQRLAVAAAVAMRPRLLVMDEPTANLDPSSARRVLALARDAASIDGAAVLVVSNDVDLLAEHVGRVIWLEAGRVRADGPPEEVFATVSRETDGALAPLVTDLCRRRTSGAGALPVTVEAAALVLGRGG